MITSGLLHKHRQQTPGLGRSVHLNHAGASLLSMQTYAAIQRHFYLESEVGPIEAAARVADQITQLRSNAALLIHARPEEIAFMPSGSAAFGVVFSSFPALCKSDTILVGQHEWGSNLSNYERLAAKTGAAVKVIPCKPDGSVDAGALETLVDDSVRLISLTWLPSNGGLINDAVAIGKVAKKFGIPYLVDAAQALGHLPIDVDALQCDVLFATGRKHLRAPRGTALLYVRNSFLKELDPRYVDAVSAPRNSRGYELRKDARKFESSEFSTALWLGFANAVSEALELGVGNIAKHEQAAAAQLRRRLAELPGVYIRDLGSEPLSGIISFTVDGVDVPSIKHQLGFSGVQIASNGAAYTPLDMNERGLAFVARASVSYLNTERDFDVFVDAIKLLKP